MSEIIQQIFKKPHPELKLQGETVTIDFELVKSSTDNPKFIRDFAEIAIRFNYTLHFGKYLMTLPHWELINLRSFMMTAAAAESSSNRFFMLWVMFLAMAALCEGSFLAVDDVMSYHVRASKMIDAVLMSRVDDSIVPNWKEFTLQYDLDKYFEIRNQKPDPLTQ